MNPKELSDRLWDFAARIGKLVDALPETRLGRHVASQLLRCGTAPAPNYDESRAAESKADFIHKIGVVLKELVETTGWLRFVVKTSLLTQRKLAPLLHEAEQLEKIIASSRLTAQGNPRKSPIINLQSSIFNQSAAMSGRLSKSATFAALPPPWPEDLRPPIRAAVAAHPNHKVVVIDDDPTGTQTVYGVPVLTSWEVERLRSEFNGSEPCLYILTNSRSLPPEEARTLTLALARNLRSAAGTRAFTLVSRSDSTLRGHFPLETDALAEVLGPFDATLLIPYFEDGGRYTIDDTHYIAEDDALIPTAETAFACDAVFGYRSSHLPTYVEERSGGRIKASAVQSIGLTDLRRGGPDAITARLLALPAGAVAVINAAALRDLDVFVAGLLAAEAQGRRFCFRTAAQFPAARLGLEPRPTLTARELGCAGRAVARAASGSPSRDYSLLKPILPPSEPHRQPSGVAQMEREPDPIALPHTGGLIVVGSHVPMTTRQLAAIAEIKSLLRIELHVDQLLTGKRRQILEHISLIVARALSAAQDVVIFTSRHFVRGDTPAQSLHICQRISDAVVELVQRLEVRPRFILAKGGITSSDVATRGLGVKRAMVLGQLLPGVPVWRLGLETKFPDLTYIVFPGNVGGPNDLAEAVKRLNQP